MFSSSLYFERQAENYLMNFAFQLTEFYSDGEDGKAGFNITLKITCPWATSWKIVVLSYEKYSQIIGSIKKTSHTDGSATSTDVSVPIDLRSKLHRQLSLRDWIRCSTDWSHRQIESFYLSSQNQIKAERRLRGFYHKW